MMRGIHIPRSAVSGAITFWLFGMRAASVYVWSENPQWLQDIVHFFNDPIVVFIAFMIAGLIIIYPWLKSWRAFIIAPMMTALIVFFVYTYYVL